MQFKRTETRIGPFVFSLLIVSGILLKTIFAYGPRIL